MHFDTVTKYLRRYPYQGLSATIIMTITFFTISLFAVLTIISISLVSYFESRPQLTAFFKEGVEQSEIQALQSQIQATGKASTIKYVSKEAALKIYQKQNEQDPLLLDLVTAEILPASLEVQPKQAEDLPELAQIVKGSKGVDQVVYQEDIIKTLVSWTNAFKKVGIGLIAVLILESLLVIITIIGIKIAVRREEIEIMRLIGATNWFIRAPFLIEGMLYGVLGAILGWGVSFALLFYFTPALSEVFKGLPIFPVPTLVLLELLALEVVTAAILGYIASYIAVRRYLR